MKNPQQFNKKQAILVALLVLVLGFGFYVSYLKVKGYFRDSKKEVTNKIQSAINPKVSTPTTLKTTPSPTPEPTPIILPESVLIEVPYTVQAPYNNWDIHEESCEESAAIMIHYFLEGQIYFNGSTVIPVATANHEMIMMKNWQVQNYGREPDLTIEMFGKFLKDYYGYNYRTSEATTFNIKKELSAGNPVMVPVITHGLENPYYGPNPSYHILVIKGYKPGGIISNDAGVGVGESYFYTWDILFAAIDRQTPQLGQGRVMIVVWK